MNKYFTTNQKLWDSKTEFHKNSEFYDLKNFKKGKTSLNKYELEALGDVSGKSILHLQCHFGQDTLSWARMGAKCTGADLSSKSIELARQLNNELGLDAKFVQSNVLELDQNLEGQFDIVFTSYGTVCWLPDLNQWAKVINHFLKPGGTFYIAEFHPVINMLDWDNNTFAYPYFNPGHPFEEEEEGTYADKTANIKLKEYFWLHSISQVMSPLLEQGLQLVEFKEFPFSPYNCFPNMKPVDDGMYVFWDEKLGLPHVYSMKMRKPL